MVSTQNGKVYFENEDLVRLDWEISFPEALGDELDEADFYTEEETKALNLILALFEASHGGVVADPEYWRGIARIYYRTK